MYPCKELKKYRRIVKERDFMVLYTYKVLMD